MCFKRSSDYHCTLFLVTVVQLIARYLVPSVLFASTDKSQMVTIIIIVYHNSGYHLKLKTGKVTTSHSNKAGFVKLSMQNVLLATCMYILDTHKKNTLPIRCPHKPFTSRNIRTCVYINSVCDHKGRIESHSKLANDVFLP